MLIGAAGFANGGLPRVGRNHRIQRGGPLRARDFTSYSTSSRDSTPNLSFGTVGQTTQVNAGVTRWLSGLGTHNFYGNVNNYGNIIVSQTDYLKTASAGGQTSDYSGADANNGNLLTGAGSLISLNDYGAASAPTYDWHLYTMENYGSLQMCGRGDTGGTTYQLYCQNTCHNYGLIDMGQYTNNLGAAFVWRNEQLYAPGATSITNTYNEGLFRITNVVYHNVQNVLGFGCYQINLGAVLYLEDGSGYYQNLNFGPTFPNQTIYFSDPTAILHMDTQVYSHNSNFGPQVYGYGAGNAIEFYEVFPTTNVFTYDGTGGVLTVRLTGGNSVKIKIGTGYDASQFYVANNPTHYNTGGYNAIFYRGATPSQSVPSICSAAPVSTCADPGQTAAAYFATYVTTTVPYTGSVTSTTTIAPSGTNSGTVEVLTPASYVTTTVIYTGVEQLTAPSTTTIPPSGTAPGTVEVFTPASYVTTTVIYTGAEPSTTTIPPSGTAPGTVEVFAPASYVTITTLYTGTSAIADPVTTTIPPSGTAPGTVEILTPASYVTTSVPYTGTSQLTAPFTFIIPPSGTNPGTVEVFTPAPYVTTTVPDRGSPPITAPVTTTIPPSGTNPGIVEVITPTITSSPTATRPAVLTTTNGPNQCVCRPATC